MEDAATAEISRTQLWQWRKAAAITTSGETITENYLERLIPEELDKIKNYVGDAAYENGRFPEAIELFRTLVYTDEFIDFLTLPAYQMI